MITDQDVVSLSEKCSRKSTDYIASMLHGAANEHQSVVSALTGSVTSGFEDVPITATSNIMDGSTPPQPSENKSTRRQVGQGTSTTTEKLQTGINTLKLTPPIEPKSDSIATHSASPDCNSILPTVENHRTAPSTPVSRFSRFTAKIRNSVRKLSASLSRSLSSPPSSPSPLSPTNIEPDGATALAQEKTSLVTAAMFAASKPSAISSPVQPTSVLNSRECTDVTEMSTPASSLLREHSLPQTAQRDALSAATNTSILASSRHMEETDTLASEAAVAGRMLGSIPETVPNGSTQANIPPVKATLTTRPVGTAARIVQLNGTKVDSMNTSKTSTVLRNKNEHCPDIDFKHGTTMKNELVQTALDSSSLDSTTKSIPDLAETKYRSSNHPSALPRVSSADPVESQPKRISRLFSTPSDAGASKTNKLSRKLSKIVHRSRIVTRHASEPKRERPRSGSFLTTLKDKLSLSHSLQKKAYGSCEDHTLIAVPTEAIRALSPLEIREPKITATESKLQEVKKAKAASHPIDNETKSSSGENWLSKVQKDGKHVSEDGTQNGSKAMLNGGAGTATSNSAQQSQVSRCDTYLMRVQNEAYSIGKVDDHCEPTRKKQLNTTIPPLDERKTGSDDPVQRAPEEEMSHIAPAERKLVAPTAFATSDALISAEECLQERGEAKKLDDNTVVQKLQPRREIPVAAPRRRNKSIRKITTSSEQPSAKGSHQTSSETLLPVDNSVRIAGTMSTPSVSVSTDVYSPGVDSNKQNAVTVNSSRFAERGTSSLLRRTKSSLEPSFPQTRGSPKAASVTKLSSLGKGGIQSENDRRGASVVAKAWSFRNEQAKVTTKWKTVDEGLTTQPYTGAGRVPTIIVDGGIKDPCEHKATEGVSHTDLTTKSKQKSSHENRPPQIQTDIKRRWCLNRDETLPFEWKASSELRSNNSNGTMSVKDERIHKIDETSHQKKPVEMEGELICPYNGRKLMKQSENWHRSEPSVSQSQIENTVQLNTTEGDNEANEKSNAFKSGLISMRCSKPTPEPDRFDEHNKLARKQALLTELERLHASVSNSDNGSTLSKLSVSSEEGTGTFDAALPLPMIAKAELLAASRGAFTPHVDPNSTLFPLKRSIDVRRSFNVKSKKPELSSSAGGLISGCHLQGGKVPSVKVIKQSLLNWCQYCLKDYPVKVWNFSSCWADGMAFCALTHRFASQSTRFDFSKLKPQNRRDNLTLAFSVAEKNGVVPLLEVDDMLEMGDEPDWKCVFVYVQSFYRQFKDRL